MWGCVLYCTHIIEQTIYIFFKGDILAPESNLGVSIYVRNINLAPLNPLYYLVVACENKYMATYWVTVYLTLHTHQHNTAAICSYARIHRPRDTHGALSHYLMPERWLTCQSKVEARIQHETVNMSPVIQ